MTRPPLFGLLLVALLTPASAAEAPPATAPQRDGAAGLAVGMAQRDITPPVGMRLCGAFHERLSTGIHDPLLVRAVVFSQGKTAFAVAGCDLAMISPTVAAEARKAIASSCGIPPQGVLIHASETHNGPDYVGVFREAFHRRAIEEHGRDPAEPVDYPRMLAERIAAAVAQAHQNMRPTRLAAGAGVCQGIAFNRRFRMADGSIGWNPGKGNPDIVEAAGPVDPSVPVMAFYQGADDAPRGILTGFAMHLAILDDREYGADYPHYLSSHLRRRLRPDLFVHFLQAPCCEVNHIDVSHQRPQRGHAWAEHVGKALADSVATALPTLEPITAPSLAVGAKWVPLRLRRHPADEVARQRALWRHGDRRGAEFLDLVHAATVTDIHDRRRGGPVPVLLQALRVDANTALIGLPSEVSVEFGLSIKKGSPFPRTFVVQLSNDWLGYIPPQRIFDEGQYEAVVAQIAPGQGERLAREAVALLRDLKKR